MEETNVLNYLKEDQSSPSGLVWLKRPARSVQAGQIAGHLYQGKYYRVLFKGRRYLSHRLLWELHNGPIPEGMLVDHVDGNSLNNVIGNLRLATYTENNYNQAKVAGKQLPKGISERTSKPGYYSASIRHAGKRYYKGSYDLEVVLEWLHNQRDVLHGEFASNG